MRILGVIAAIGITFALNAQVPDGAVSPGEEASPGKAAETVHINPENSSRFSYKERTWNFVVAGFGRQYYLANDSIQDQRSKKYINFLVLVLTPANPEIPDSKELVSMDYMQIRWGVSGGTREIATIANTEDGDTLIRCDPSTIKYSPIMNGSINYDLLSAVATALRGSSFSQD